MAARKRKSTIRPGLGNASFFRRVPLAQGLLGETFAKRHPYLAAHEAFVAGWITREQAVEHILTDREFIAEAELNYLGGRTDLPPRAAARRIVDNEWLRDAVRAAQETKRCAV